MISVVFCLTLAVQVSSLFFLPHCSQFPTASFCALTSSRNRSNQVAWLTTKKLIAPSSLFQSLKVNAEKLAFGEITKTYTPMPVVTKLKPCARPVTEPRAVLGPAGNRVGVSQEPKRWKPQCQTDKVPEIPESIVQTNASVDSAYSSDSSSTNSSAKSVKSVKRNEFKSVKVVPDGVHVAALSPKDLGPAKRCDWITPNSDPLYTAFHDEEWGVPVKDDKKLFELLVFSQALAEHRWPAILNLREIFRKLFENFDPSSIAQFTEKNLQMLKVNGTPLLSDPKFRAVVENAKQLLKVQKEFGSFSNYCWRFVNQKPIRNQFRYGRQVPVKAPKAEAISKDMMRRGFQCVGPTVVYSFMQVAGLVNDHLVTCFRYQECAVATTKVEQKVVENNGAGTDSLIDA